MQNQMFGRLDLVSVKGETGTWKVTGTRDGEPKYQVQLGNDGSAIKWVSTDVLTLVQRAPNPGQDSGFYTDSLTNL